MRVVLLIQCCDVNVIHGKDEKLTLFFDFLHFRRSAPSAGSMSMIRVYPAGASFSTGRGLFALGAHPGELRLSVQEELPVGVPQFRPVATIREPRLIAQKEGPIGPRETVPRTPVGVFRPTGGQHGVIGGSKTGQNARRYP